LPASLPTRRGSGSLSRRDLCVEVPKRSRSVLYLIRDRDSKFIFSFDEVLRSEGVRIIKTPVRSPRANAFAERSVGTVRRECLNRMLILHRRQLEAVLVEYVDHYNSHRPHRSLARLHGWCIQRPRSHHLLGTSCEGQTGWEPYPRVRISHLERSDEVFGSYTSGNARG
jgi:hypothetical protein